MLTRSANLINETCTRKRVPLLHLLPICCSRCGDYYAPRLVLTQALGKRVCHGIDTESADCARCESAPLWCLFIVYTRRKTCTVVVCELSAVLLLCFVARLYTLTETEAAEYRVEIEYRIMLFLGTSTKISVSFHINGF